MFRATEIGTEEYKVPDISESVSMDEKGNIHITLGNLSPSADNSIEIQFSDKKVSQITGTILKGDMAAYNTFDQPEQVKEENFTGYSVTDQGSIKLTLPPCCVLHLEVNS